MNFNIKKHYNNLLFLPLGGAGEIGMNLNLYHYQGKFLLVDMGIGFADDHLPGIDIVVPNINFLIKNRKNIVGLILTHAHEDHIGAVPYLWEDLKCPIYTTKFTAAVLKSKLREFKLTEELKIIELNSNSNFKVDPFSIEMVEITHSIPEMNALLIKTPIGNVFHTGDWKLDPSPVIGNTTDEEKLKEIGKQGILAMVSDSTNIFSSGHSGSEGDLADNFVKLIKGYTKNLIVVTTFASNIARLYSIAKAAEKLNRKVILLGHSLWRIYKAAKDTGYLQDIKPFLKDTAIRDYKRNELLIVCTGCQGEKLAATNKLANKSHQKIKLQKNDAVIFSSKIIPGNEKKIFALFNKFCHMGIEVLTEKDHFVHVSGHPYRDEVSKMYDMIKPKIAIPVHGEAIHLHEHCKFAKKKGIKTTVEVENGDVILIDEKNTEKLVNIESGCFAIDGNFILDEKSQILKNRAIMKDHGIVFVVLIVNKKGKLLKKPMISTPGLMDEREDEELIATLQDNVANILSTFKTCNDVKIKKSVQSSLKKFLKKEVNKEPMIIVKVEQV